ncbi:unnamed protein product [Calypogeia fissa]
MYVTCENLVQDLTAARVGEEGCPVILVGHSIGCLVMKELCTTLSKLLGHNSNEFVQNLFLRVKGLFYYACPHHGSELADSSTVAVKGLLFEDLTTQNKVAGRRNEEFRKLRQKYKWKTFGMGERRPTTSVSLVVVVANFILANITPFSIDWQDKEGHGPKIYVLDGTVGPERWVKKIIEMLKAARRLGIVGMGGDSGFLTREEFICHPVEALDDEESEKLFSLNAFIGRDNVLNDQKQQVMGFCRKCGGLPLALRVIGRYLKGETEEEVWEEVLAKLQNAEPPDGQREDELWSLLQLSYNSYKEEEQQMFLDIAVCFHDDDLDIVKCAWTECGWASPHVGLKNLVE